MYVQTTALGFHGIAEESVATGRILIKIDPLPADYGGAAGGLGPDGWSPRTRKVTTLEPAGQHGGALSPPVFFDPGHELARMGAGRRQPAGDRGV